MAEKTMTLVEALNMKKSLRRKIDKRLIKIKLAYLAASTDDIAAHKEYYDNYKIEMKAVYQSLCTLRKNYDILCNAINIANAKTKTDMLAPDGTPYTISQLIAMQNDNISDEIVKALDYGYDRVRSKQTGYIDIQIIDPFIGMRDQIVKYNEDLNNSIKEALYKANAKKKIKVEFAD